MGMMEKMMEYMLGRMSEQEKEEMMNKMMEKFFTDMTPEDKQKIMEEMMPKMMQGVDIMEMMPKMMKGMMKGGESECGKMMEMMSKMMGKEGEISMMPQMMTEMMPHCLKMMLPKIPKEKRIDFVLNTVSSLMEQGSTGMSEDEKKNFVARVAERLKT